MTSYRETLAADPLANSLDEDHHPVAAAEAVDAYAAAVEALPSKTSSEAAGRALEALVARDRVARALADGGLMSAADLLRLRELDERLKAAARTIDAAVGSAELRGWRETIQPPASSWWWWLDEHVAAEETRHHPLWDLFAGSLMLTISLSLTAEIAGRFLADGANLLGIFSAVSSLLLSLLGGTAFTGAGGRIIEPCLQWLGVRRKYLHIGKTVAALLFLLIVVAIRVSFPAFAAYFDEQGAAQYASGRIGEAIDNFQRAISLDGDNVKAHYNLANAYEDVLEWDQAFASYQTALRLDSTFAPALSNLARLNMVRRGDYATALALLREADNLDLPRSRDDDLVRYSIQVNLARAFLGLELFAEAEAAAQRATGLFREWATTYFQGSMEGASAHCVLAQVYESPKNPRRNDGAALDEWRQCALWGPSQKLIVESSWLGIAEARVRAAEGGTKP